MDVTARDKIKAGEPFNFRPAELGQKIVELIEEIEARGGSLTPTTVMREGLLGCWPQVRTHLLIRHTTPAAQQPHLPRLIALTAKLLEHGLTPEQIEQHLTAALEQQLSASPE